MGVGTGVSGGVVAGVETGVTRRVAWKVACGAGARVGVGWGVGLAVARGVALTAVGVGVDCRPGWLVGVGSLADPPWVAGFGVGTRATAVLEGTGVGVTLGVGDTDCTWAGGAWVGLGDGPVATLGAGVGDGTAATLCGGATVGPIDGAMVPNPSANPARTRLTTPSARTRRARCATVTTIGSLLSAGCDGGPGELNGSTRPTFLGGGRRDPDHPSSTISIGS